MTSDQAHSRISGNAVFSILVKIVFTTAFILITLQAWIMLDQARDRQGLLDAWSVTNQFAVFYPHYIGNDAEELQTGGNETTAIEATSLYPILDEKGALFIDASNYANGTPPKISNLPAWPILVNCNYLEAFPVLDENGKPIVVDPGEIDWVVAVPEQYRDQEEAIRALYQESRRGADFRRAQEAIIGVPAPDSFANQGVTIIWTQENQDIFSFDSRVNPTGASTIRDPIIEIMTPSNSLPIDRINSITGEVNTPLKVRTDGDPGATLEEIRPTLRELGLEDNLRDLIVPNEAIMTELTALRQAVMRTGAVIVVTLLVALTFTASLVAVLTEHDRRRLIIRRLNGFGFIRTYREILLALGGVWLAIGVLAIAVSVAFGATVQGQSAVHDPFVSIPRLVVLLLAELTLEVAFVSTAAIFLERRKMVERLKEL